jgi:hypothetical protein
LQDTIRTSSLDRIALGRVIPAILAFVAIVIPPALMAVIIHRYAVNVPYSDEWDTLWLVLADRQGRLDFASLWAQHNEHRLLTVNVVSVLSARLTDYNMVANVYCGYVFELLALVLVWRILVITLRGADLVLIRPLTVYASLLLFWAVAMENWMWGISAVEFLSSVFWATAVVWALAEWPGQWLGLVVAFSSAILGICTSGNGFPLLLIIAVALVANGRGKTLPWGQLVAFVVLAGIFVAFFFRGWTPIFNFSADQPKWKSVLETGAYALTYIGSPFVTRFGWKVAMPMGLLGLLWFLICLWRVFRNTSNSNTPSLNIPTLAGRTIPWALLALYVIVNAELTGYGRLRFGLGQATSSRYRSIATLFWISIGVISAVLVRRWLQEPALRRAVLIASVVVITGLGGAYADSYYKGVHNIQVFSWFRHYDLGNVLNYRTATDDQLRMSHPFPDRVRQMAEKLESLRIGPFAHTPSPGSMPQ